MPSKVFWNNATAFDKSLCGTKVSPLAWMTAHVRASAICSFLVSSFLLTAFSVCGVVGSCFPRYHGGGFFDPAGETPNAS